MEHYKESQYDDDLTVGMDSYDEDFDSSGDHLLDFIGDEEFPLTRLKSIILSIDWEINDDILRQFNEELVYLKDLWQGEKINLVYVQALDKISRYIYKEKSSAHPNAIKLLLTFYTNLEKIVSDEEMSDNDKKEILAIDVQRFEKFKKLILPGLQEKRAAQVQGQVAIEAEQEGSKDVHSSDMFEDDDPLLNLKAIVYGIDWEITSRDLDNLAKEVATLEQRFSSSKAKLIFLQGIGSLGAYISLKKSDAHVDAFTLLHSFYAGFEKVVVENLSGEAEKKVLLAEVDKFNDFKKIVEKTIIGRNDALDFEEVEEYESENIQPAFSDMPEDVHGFQAEEGELEKIAGPGALFGEEDEDFAEEEVSGELANEMESRLENMFDEPGLDSVKSLDREIALAGVNVESDADDDSDEEPLPLAGDEFAPALSTGGDFEEIGSAPAAFSDSEEDLGEEQTDLVLSPESEETVTDVTDSPDEATIVESNELDSTQIPGVNVETDADDDSDEDPLPLQDGELAPALFDDNEKSEESITSSLSLANIENDVEAFFTDPDDAVSVETNAESIIATEGNGEEETDLKLDQETENKIDNFFTEADEITTDSGDEDYTAAVVENDPEQVAEDTSQTPEEGDILDETSESNGIDDVVDQKVTAFFGEPETTIHSDEDVALSGVDVEREDDDDSDEVELPMDGDDYAPALNDTDIPYAESKSDDEHPQVLTEAEDVISDDGIEENVEPVIAGSTGEKSRLPEMKLDQLSDDMMDAFSASGKKSIVDNTAEDVPVVPGKEEGFIFEAVDDERHGEEATDDGDVIFTPVDDETDEDVLIMQGARGQNAEDPVPGVAVTEEEVIFVAADDDALEELEIIEVDGVAIGDTAKAEFSEEREENTTEPEKLDSILLGTPLGQELPFDAIEELDDEDEVGFQAADDIGRDFDESQIYSTTLLQEESPLLGEKLDDLIVEKLTDEVVSAAQMKTAGAAYISSAEDSVLSSDRLSGLRNTIAEIEKSSDSGAIGNLNSEIEFLRSGTTTPMEKTYIQLLTTISEHIQKYEAQPDRESVDLLHSVFDKLELSLMEQKSAEEKQELLLTETSKVLQWQQRLIDRNPQSRTEPVEFLDNTGRAEQRLPDEAVDKTQINMDTSLDSMSAKVDELGDDLLMEKVSSVMKSELEELKLSFHEEIQRLREEIVRGRG